jgi:hypothetical protein
MNVALWILQVLLAALFLFAGGVKLVTPIEEMLKQMPLALPGWFLRLTGVIEVLGAIGVIVPWLTGIRPGLTPLAAGDRHDRSRDLHNPRWRYRHGADPARCGAFMRFGRLRALASGAVSRIG